MNITVKNISEQKLVLFGDSFRGSEGFAKSRRAVLRTRRSILEKIVNAIHGKDLIPAKRKSGEMTFPGSTNKVT
jgi:hypothetical protein